MDIISGIVAVSSALIVALAVVGTLQAVVLAKNPSAPSTGHSLVNRILATVVVVYFLALANLLIIAQQLGPALASFLIGLVVVAVLYVEPAIRAGRRRPNDGEEEDTWRH